MFKKGSSSLGSRFSIKAPFQIHDLEVTYHFIKKINHNDAIVYNNCDQVLSPWRFGKIYKILRK